MLFRLCSRVMSAPTWRRSTLPESLSWRRSRALVTTSSAVCASMTRETRLTAFLLTARAGAVCDRRATGREGGTSPSSSELSSQVAGLVGLRKDDTGRPVAGTVDMRVCGWERIERLLVDCDRVGARLERWESDEEELDGVSWTRIRARMWSEKSRSSMAKPERAMEICEHEPSGW